MIPPNVSWRISPTMFSSRSW